jgi:hypothetical protein
MRTAIGILVVLCISCGCRVFGHNALFEEHITLGEDDCYPIRSDLPVRKYRAFDCGTYTVTCKVVYVGYVPGYHGGEAISDCVNNETAVSAPPPPPPTNEELWPFKALRWAHSLPHPLDEAVIAGSAWSAMYFGLVYVAIPLFGISP